MRKVVLLEHVSLDGFMAGPNGEMNWIRLDDALWDVVTELQKTADAAIYGRRTFEMMVGYWPTAAEQPGATQHDIDHGRWVNAATKYAFSSTLKETDWANTRFVDGDPIESVTRIKQEPGGDMLLIGSASLAASFIAADLVDEYLLNLNPVVLGGGTPLFRGGNPSLGLELISSTPHSGGNVILRYLRARGA